MILMFGKNSNGFSSKPEINAGICILNTLGPVAMPGQCLLNLFDDPEFCCPQKNLF